MEQKSWDLIEGRTQKFVQGRGLIFFPWGRGAYNPLGNHRFYWSRGMGAEHHSPHPEYASVRSFFLIIQYTLGLDKRLENPLPWIFLRI